MLLLWTRWSLYCVSVLEDYSKVVFVTSCLWERLHDSKHAFFSPRMFSMHFVWVYSDSGMLNAAGMDVFSG